MSFAAYQIKPPPQLFPPDDETVIGLTRMLRTGQISSVELVERCLARIDRWEAELQAWVIVDRDGALRQAADCDRQRKSGAAFGPLHGIPIGIKDIIDVAGFTTGAGSLRLARSPAAVHDAHLVADLRRAGAIILGKTVTTQFACFDPAKTKNPWNFERTPGGSSSGSAAAVAVGMCPVAIGSQTGGSITRPASFCGIAGCKPTFGRISTAGVFPVSTHLDHPGPLARTVHDLAIVMGALCGSGGALIGSMEVKSPPRIGRLSAPFDEVVSVEMREAVDRACAMWQREGALVQEIDLPGQFFELFPHHRRIMATEAADVHKTWLMEYPDDYLPGMRSLIEEGLAVPAVEYLRSRRHQQELQPVMAGCFADVDVLVCPATTGSAPDRTTTGDPACNSPWSYTGLPTVSFPIGLAADGLPLAVQLIGPADGEGPLLSAGRWCEDVLRRV